MAGFGMVFLFLEELFSMRRLSRGNEKRSSLLRKGDTEDPGNYRGITLASGYC